MLRLAIALLALGLLAALVVAGRRRRRLTGERRIETLPAGLRHLASHVGAISTFGMGLPLPPHGVGRRRPGTLISVR